MLQLKQPNLSLRRKRSEMTKADLEVVLAVREEELIESRGHCLNRPCRLHWNHRGDCDK